MDDLILQKKIDDRIKYIVPQISRGSGFTDRKLTDTPNDRNQVVSRGYVTNSGPTSSRPRSSVVGQFYLDTTINRPVWWNGTSFIDAAGNVV